MFRFLKWPSDRRLRLLSVSGAAVLAIMCGSAIAVWLNGGQLPLSLPITGQGNETDSEFGLGAGAQSGPSSPASRSPAITPSAGGLPLSGSAHLVPLKASYRTVALLGLGGFDTEVTVRNPGDAAHEGWTVVLTMPDETVVENRSTALVKIEQKGAIVTITPVKPTVLPAATLTFTIRFPALLAVGKAAKDCKINGDPCAAA